MRAMVFEGTGPLRLSEWPLPRPNDQEILVRVEACGVCRTYLHLLAGELRGGNLPIIPGHQAVGRLVSGGSGRFREGERVGVAWLGWTCGSCRECLAGRENLCPRARFTGFSLDGGFADYLVADERYCFKIPEGFTPVHAAPLLCAGLIGFRSLRMAPDAARVGLYGFGASAHLVVQMALFEGQECYAFTRAGDRAGQDFALRMGASWAGDSTVLPPEPLDAAIIFAPAGELVPLALQAVRPGGQVVCAGIHMSQIPAFPYDLLWGERSLRSVANLTRADGIAFLDLAARIPIQTDTKVFPLEGANAALEAVQQGRVQGSAVLEVSALGE
jgi:propanol-preferring alcohol dehydrogenase